MQTSALKGFLLLLPCLLLYFPLTGQLPDDFNDEVFLSGFDFPTGLTFDDNGRLYVCEKKGVVWIVDTTGQRLTEPLIDISEEVSNWKDQGLMGFALDPDFLSNGRFYLYYTLDLHHYFHYGTPEYHPDTTVTFDAAIARVTRYEADPAAGFTTTDPDSRKVLLGKTLADGIPILYEFHGTGSLITGQDGTLLLSAGDATSAGDPNTGGDFNGTMISRALELGIITQDQDVGSFRSQYLGSLNGKILRIDPETGDGLPSNPFYQADDPRAPRSRIWTRGLRNPYRIALRPNTGSHYPEDGQPGVIYAGDVGNGAWEEIDVVTEGGMNFGWPLFEGVRLNWGFWVVDAPYDRLAPNPLYGENGCDQPFFTFRDLLTWPRAGVEPIFDNPCDPDQVIPAQYHPQAQDMPAIFWNNARWNGPTRAMVPFVNPETGDYIGAVIGGDSTEVAGEKFDGFSSLAGVFYIGNNYPEEYRGKYFGLDFSGWIRVFDFDEENHLQAVAPFHDNAGDIIHLALGSRDGFLYYLNLQGEVHRITYGGNPAPVAVIEADRFYGPGPLTVRFDASGSYDANGPVVAYAWDFGDGTTSTGPQPEHTFTAPGGGAHSYTVTLTVTDSLGATAAAEAVVSLNNSPPAARISSFEDGDRYPLDRTTLLRLAAEVEDAEHANEELAYEWRVYLHHNDHFHPEPPVYDPLSYALISPLGCQEELYWYRVELTVTDPEGLSARDSRTVHPDCGAPVVTFTQLEGTAAEESIELMWEMQTERDLTRLEVQRTTDFFHYETIGSVSPANGAGPEQAYRFTDTDPVYGSNIYRVKAVSDDRAYDYSNLATVTFPDGAAARVWPNPARSKINWRMEEAPAGKVSLELFDARGLPVLRAAWPATPGAPWQQALPTRQLADGAYYYRLISGKKETTGRVLIAR